MDSPEHTRGRPLAGQGWSTLGQDKAPHTLMVFVLVEDHQREHREQGRPDTHTKASPEQH